MRRVSLPFDPLPTGCTSSALRTSAGASTIPLHIILGRPKADGPYTGLHPAYAPRGSGYAWSGELLACWKTCILGPILDGGRGVETKSDSDFSSPQVRPRLKVDVRLQDFRQDTPSRLWFTTALTYFFVYIFHDITMATKDSKRIHKEKYNCGDKDSTILQLRVENFKTTHKERKGKNNRIRHKIRTIFCWIQKKKVKSKSVTSRNTNSKLGSLQDSGYLKLFLRRSYLYNPVDFFCKKKITFLNFSLPELFLSVHDKNKNDRFVFTRITTSSQVNLTVEGKFWFVILFLCCILQNIHNCYWTVSGIVKNPVYRYAATANTMGRTK